MPTFRSLMTVVGLNLFAACCCWGNTQYQSLAFDITLSNQPDGTYNVINVGDLIMNNVAPYSAGGTLLNFSVGWNFTFTASGTSAGPGGFLQESIGGTYYLGGVPYDGNGNANAATANFGGDPVVVPPIVLGSNWSFDVPDQNQYNPALLAVVMGSSDYSAEWDTGFKVMVGNMANWTAEAVGTVVVTYTDNLPEPSAFLLTFGGIAALGFRFFRTDRALGRRLLP